MSIAEYGYLHIGDEGSGFMWHSEGAMGLLMMLASMNELNEFVDS